MPKRSARYSGVGALGWEIDWRLPKFRSPEVEPKELFDYCLVLQCRSLGRLSLVAKHIVSQRWLSRSVSGLAWCILSIVSNPHLSPRCTVSPSGNKPLSSLDKCRPRNQPSPKSSSLSINSILSPRFKLNSSGLLALKSSASWSVQIRARNDARIKMGGTYERPAGCLQVEPGSATACLT